MKISLEQLAAFTETVDRGSFSAAARAMGKAQSAVSTAVMNLEIDLGVTLFDRSGKYPRLSSEGEALLRDARQILAKGKDFEDKARALSMGVESGLTIALDEVLPWEMILSLLKRFGMKFPHVDLEILNATLGDAKEMVKSGRAHIGVIVPLTVPPLEKNMRFVGNMRFLPAVSPLHPLAGLDSVTLSDLSPHRQLMVTSRGGERETSEYVLSGSAWWVESVYAMRDMIRDGLGWGFLPEYMIREGREEGRLKKLSLTAMNTELHVPLVLTWTPSGPLGPAGTFLITELEKMKRL